MPWLRVEKLRREIATQGYAAARTQSSRSGCADTGVQDVAEAVAQEVEPKHHQHDCHAWEDRQPGRQLHEPARGIQHPAPAWLGRLGAEPEEAQRRLAEDS